MARSIQEMYEKFKRLLEDDSLFYGLIIVLGCALSFGLGRWSMVEVGDPSSQSASMVMTQRGIEVSSSTPKTSVEEPKREVGGKEASTYVASKKGTKYHLPSCPVAAQIKEENKVYFDTKEEAEASGYSPAANCKGI